MAFVAQYTREQWEAVGDFSAVEPWVTHVEFLFFPEYDEDEDAPPQRTEQMMTTAKGERVRYITDSAMRPYRLFTRDEAQGGVWRCMEMGKRLITESFLVGVA